MKEKVESFIEVIESKIDEGIERLKFEQIGTKEYDMLVSQVMSSFNLVEDAIEKYFVPQPKDPKQHIGKEFK